MLKPTRTVLALATGSLVLGLVAAGAAGADEGPGQELPPREIIVGVQPWPSDPGAYPEDRYALGRVVSKGPLKVRSKPTTHSQSLGYVYPRSRVEIACKKYGENVGGNRVWYRLAERDGAGANGSGRTDRAASYEKERWVSARYVKNLSEVRYCR
ncbi:hypothetical protein [Streptomyces sp. NPDC023588]|uniref:hypothetical protein n=1 Tax=Streptomyces sp. NPDC023588 TaxID=3154907 RepID=UPI0034070F07